MPTLDTDPRSAGPVPAANRPGHHPLVEQDKPRGLPGRARGRHPFRFDAALRLPALVLGVTPLGSYVEVGDEDLVVRYGSWVLRTSLSNVAGAAVTGPYSILKVGGPPRLSLADRGITFGTSTRGGVCISFAEPVPAILPSARLRHPAATVTVEDPAALVAELEALAHLRS